MDEKKFIPIYFMNFLVWGLALAAFLFFGSPSARAEISDPPQISLKESLQGILVFWAKPSLRETEDVVLIRKEASCPDSVSDGKELYRGSGSFFEDSSLETGKSYCYGAFVHDYSGSVSALRITDVVEKKGRMKYMLYQTIENNNLTFGLIVVAALFWINRVTMRKRIENKKVVMRI